MFIASGGLHLALAAGPQRGARVARRGLARAGHSSSSQSLRRRRLEQPGIRLVHGVTGSQAVSHASNYCRYMDCEWSSSPIIRDVNIENYGRGICKHVPRATCLLLFEAATWDFDCSVYCMSFHVFWWLPEV